MTPWADGVKNTSCLGEGFCKHLLCKLSSHTVTLGRPWGGGGEAGAEEAGFLSALPLSLGLSRTRRQAPVGLSVLDELGPWWPVSLLIQTSQQGTGLHLPSAQSSSCSPLGLTGGTGAVLAVGMGRNDVTGSALGAVGAGSVPSLPREAVAPGAEPEWKACRRTHSGGEGLPCLVATGAQRRRTLSPHVGGSPCTRPQAGAATAARCPSGLAARAGRAGLLMVPRPSPRPKLLVAAAAA